MTIKFSQNLIVLLGITSIVLVFFGCGVSEDEHEKIVSELYKTRIENDKKRDELSKSKIALSKTEAELDIIKADLDAARGELNYSKELLDKNKRNKTSTNSEFVEMEKKFNETQRILELELDKHLKDKHVIKSQYDRARMEVTYLKAELGELINRFMKTVEDLDLIKDANKALRTQIDEVIFERNRLQELTEN